MKASFVVALLISSFLAGCTATTDEASEDALDRRSSAIDQIPFDSEINGTPVRLRVDRADWSGHYDFDTRNGTTRRIGIVREDTAFPLGAIVWSGRLSYMDARTSEAGGNPPNHGGAYWIVEDGDLLWEGCLPVTGTPYGDLLVCRWKSAKGAWHEYSNSTYIGSLLQLIADEGFVACVGLLASLPEDTVPLTAPVEAQIQGALTVDCGSWALGLL